ncbi:fatty-acid amide hydrolase 2-B [Episyrphus balteatus]|uniref:fatty-acid amide hydrolase 2-B n=1 Tax=Episyrphus balteatus TaxID=286459 RepID=UPI002485AA18|nr:fatty-acid amide hydrolase 2-B [Episyrphus balteatus]XP_055854935.1 fatty-acid amide hydrolase 2-B [Episyrphus balteatus]XP_055854946.1 fatty-acid amide hydrolase 2-B [Episyrphus balteatus]
MGETNESSTDETLQRSKPFSFVLCIQHFLFTFIMKIARVIFIIIYGKKGHSMSAITEPLLLESATSLAEKIRTKQLSSVKVLEAFIRRVEEVNPMFNCVVDKRFDEALKAAAEADALVASGAYTTEELLRVKPFLGVPISTKDCIAVKDFLYTAGLYARKGVRAKEDSDAMGLMRKAGAIPFCLTNVSEMCMWWESSNTLHGRTRNPYDTNRIVGGSSGGEGCIQSLAASPFGLGSDIGGSIRMPSFFTGTFGHKPSKNIVSNKGQFPMPFSSEQDSFLGIGPMCRYAVDLKPILKVISGERSNLLNLDEPVDLKKLKYYYQESDGGSRLVSPVDEDLTYSLRKVVEYLQGSTGISATKIQLDSFKQSAAIWFANMKDDSGHGFGHQLANLNGDINPIKELLKFCVGQSKHTFIGLITALVDDAQTPFGSPKYHHLVKKRNDLRSELQDLLGENGVLIYPTHPTVAPYHNEPLVRPLNFSYTGIINVLGFPATAVPLGLGAEGLPLGVQVIANFNKDRLCLAVAEELEKAFGGWVRPEVNI